MKQFIGITRERVFSPGRVADDAAILTMVADRLRALGDPVSVCDGDDDRWPEPARDTVVFTMCQGARALQQLQQWTARGVRVINQPEGILNCQRYRTIAALARTDVSFPESVVVDANTDAVWPAWVAAGEVWVKRGDVHATEADDVVKVDGVVAARAALHRFHARGIVCAVLQRHAVGTVLKFYAVRGRFFSCAPPRGSADISPDVLQRVDALGQRAARVLNVEVYGGDCVVGVNGALTLIDLNDWPSYAPCRTVAAGDIAAYVRAPEAATET
jgi:hypothetical protein